LRLEQQQFQTTQEVNAERGRYQKSEIEERTDAKTNKPRRLG